jgi:hypothetical protein
MLRDLQIGHETEMITGPNPVHRLLGLHRILDDVVSRPEQVCCPLASLARRRLLRRDNVGSNLPGAQTGHLAATFPVRVIRRTRR